MTANQINYAKLQEEARHNSEIERYNARMAAVSEANAISQRVSANASASSVRLGYANLNEQQRHNIVNEGIDTFKAGSGFLASVGSFLGGLAKSMSVH